MKKELLDKSLTRLTDKVTVADIVETYDKGRDDPHILSQFVAEFGVEPIIFLSERVGGSMVYIPATHALVRRAHERELSQPR